MFQTRHEIRKHICNDWRIALQLPRTSYRLVGCKLRYAKLITLKHVPQYLKFFWNFASTSLTWIWLHVFMQTSMRLLMEVMHSASSAASSNETSLAYFFSRSRCSSLEHRCHLNHHGCWSVHSIDSAIQNALMISCCTRKVLRNYSRLSNRYLLNLKLSDLSRMQLTPRYWQGMIF